jgi:hypothetical protein
MPEWEHRSYSITVPALSNNMDQRAIALHQHGSRGWELVSIASQPNHPSGYGAVFKRPRT